MFFNKYLQMNLQVISNLQLFSTKLTNELTSDLKIYKCFLQKLTNELTSDLEFANELTSDLEDYT